MTDRPIIFSAAMIRALLAGQKTQTRRLLRPQPARSLTSRGKEVWTAHTRSGGGFGNLAASLVERHAPATLCHVVAGDRLWVREAWSHAGIGVWTIANARMAGPGAALYRADGEAPGTKYWPSIHMPREFSRLTLAVQDVRVQRLRDISEEDAVAEGVSNNMTAAGAMFWTPPTSREYLDSATFAFADLWKRIYGPGAWAANPWVMALTFDVRLGNIERQNGGL